jgi:uncharacterized phage protein (TIGR01671 family)
MKQREIKFRAWDKELKVMSKTKTLEEISKWYKSCFVKHGKIETKHELAFGFNKFFEWMQFIGLKDKNGVEIYEGDVLMIYQVNFDKTEIAKAKNVVRWNNAEACFDLKWTMSGLKGIGGSKFDLFLHSFRGGETNKMDWYFEIEVIGNIYENPELLKSS